MAILAARGAISLNDRNYADISTGKSVALLLQKQLNAQRSIYLAQCNYQDLVVGQNISLINHSNQTWNNVYQINNMSYQIFQPLQNRTDIAVNNRSFNNILTLIPLSQLNQQCTYMLKAVTPINQSGIMLGKITPVIDHQNLAIDEYGRYKVSLLLSDNQLQQNTTVWLRLAQMYGGNHFNHLNYGCHFPLAVGTVVLLSFINGDINRPIILGVLPDLMMPSPVTEQNRTQNIIVTKSQMKSCLKNNKEYHTLHCKTVNNRIFYY